MIEISHLVKKYANTMAVNDISFTIKRGEILGFLGRNGAGKSTTMNIISGCLSPSSGHVLVDNHDVVDEPREAKRLIGYLPEFPPLYDDMTVLEYLRFCARIKGVEAQKIRAHLGDTLELTGITDHAGRLIKHLSKGYRQRVGLAQALVGNPDVIILDEPTVGLDPRQIIEMRKLIKELGKQHTVVLSSHILHEVADVCERVVIINKGKIVAQDTLQNLTSGLSDTCRMRIRAMGSARQIEPLIMKIEGVIGVDSLGEKEKGSEDFLIESTKAHDVRASLFEAMSVANHPLLMMKPLDIGLEDIFLQLTKDDVEEVG